LILEEPVTVHNLADNEIDSPNLRYSGLRPRPMAVLAAEDDIIRVLIVVNVSCRAV
jgi:hypothetical protein